MADEPTADEPTTDALSTEATDAAPTAPKLTKSQKKKKQREEKRAARPTPIPTPCGKIVSVTQTGKVGRVKIDNSKKNSGLKKGWVQITDSTGEGSEGWVRPGALAEVEQKEQDAFEDAEKKSGGKPYHLGGSDDASGGGGDEALEKPPVSKDATVEDLGASAIDELKRYVDGPRGREQRWQAARNSAALLVDVSEAKADERAALVKSLSKTLKDAWAKYEKHREKYPDLYPEEETEEAPKKDYSRVDIDHVNLTATTKKGFRHLIQKCVANEADISWIEAMPSNQIRSTDFAKALRDAHGESRDEQRSPRLAGLVAPAMPTISRPGDSLAYTDSTDPLVICGTMTRDARSLVELGSLVPTTGLAGCARRGGFDLGVGLGAALRLVGVPGSGFANRFNKFAVHESDPAEAIGQGLRIDIRSCFALQELAELEPRLVYESELGGLEKRRAAAAERTDLCSPRRYVASPSIKALLAPNAKCSAASGLLSASCRSIRFWFANGQLHKKVEARGTWVPFTRKFLELGGSKGLFERVRKGVAQQKLARSGEAPDDTTELEARLGDAVLLARALPANDVAAGATEVASLLEEAATPAASASERKSWRPWPAGATEAQRLPYIICMLACAKQLAAYGCGPKNGEFEKRAGYFRATWLELDRAVELLVEKIGRKEFPGMQSAATISLGAWMRPFIDGADVVMFQCSSSESSGADIVSKIAGREMTVAMTSTDVSVLVLELSTAGADGLVTADTFAATWDAWASKLTDKMGNMRALVTTYMPKFDDRLGSEVVKNVLKRYDSARNDTPGTGALAIGFSLYQHNEYLKGALLRDKSALLDKDLLVKAFRHMGDRAPTTVDGIAELSVWDLKKALHVCAIDTALMEDITFAIISGLLMKLRGA